MSTEPPEDTAPVERPEDRAARGLEGLRDTVHSVPTVARDEANRQIRRWWPWLIVAAVVVGVGGGTAGSLAYVSLAGRQAVTEQRLGAQDQQLSSLRRLAQQSKTQGDAANKKLRARGQEPVRIPTPGKAPDSDVVTAAATARVFAALPGYTRDSTMLGREIARYLARNMPTELGPSPQALSASVAGYLAANPPPPGRDGVNGRAGRDGAMGATGAGGPPGQPGATGAQGPKGDPPSGEQIQAALRDYIRDNPQILCPNGGTYARTSFLSAEDPPQRVTVWACVVSEEATAPPPLVNIPN